MPKVINIVGERSKVGKTFVIEGLIKELKEGINCCNNKT